MITMAVLSLIVLVGGIFFSKRISIKPLRIMVTFFFFSIAMTGLWFVIAEICRANFIN